MTRRRSFVFCLFIFCLLVAFAQKKKENRNQLPYEQVRGVEPLNKPPLTAYAVVENGDTIPICYLNSKYFANNSNFSNKDNLNYLKLVRDVKKVYPLAKMVYTTLLETMDYLETIPDKKVREKHLRMMEKDLVDEYEPMLRKMTFTQGKILIKLINRECRSSPYDLIRVYRGSFTAFIWQGVAKIFHADLNSAYDPESKDYILEQIVQQIERGEIK